MWSKVCWLNLGRTVICFPLRAKIIDYALVVRPRVLKSHEFRCDGAGTESSSIRSRSTGEMTYASRLFQLRCRGQRILPTHSPAAYFPGEQQPGHDGHYNHACYRRVVGRGPNNQASYDEHHYQKEDSVSATWLSSSSFFILVVNNGPDYRGDKQSARDRRRIRLTLGQENNCEQGGNVRHLVLHSIQAMIAPTDCLSIASYGTC